MKNNLEGTDKLYLAFTSVLAGLMLFSAGLDAKDHHYFSMVFGIVTAFFFIGFFALTIWGRMKALRDKITAAERDADYMRKRVTDQNRMEAMKAVATAPDPQAGASTEEPKNGMPLELQVLMEEVVIPGLRDVAIHKRSHEVLEAVIEATGGYPVTEDRIEAIETAFHDHSGRYLKLALVDDGERFSTDFSDTPFEETAAVASPAAPAPSAKTMDGVKKATPAQQRKANEKKGRGAVTDAEWKAQQAEKRRVARAAKKAGTTTTTTMPGQTELV